MRQESFVVGAFVLMASSLFSRVLGATYRILVPLLMGGGHQGAVGMGLYGMAAPIYGVLLSVSATGLPVAVARMVAARVSLGRARAAQRLFRAAFVLVALVGGAFALALFFGAPWYARHVARDARAAPAVAAVAPAVLFVSLGAVYRGFLQGLRRMTPYAVSQVVEQLARVGSILLLVVLLLPEGVEWAAAGAAFGATLGGVAALAYLVRQHRQALRELAAAGPRDAGAAGAGEAGAAADLRELISLAVPISLSYMVMPLVTFIDALLVPSRLHAAGLGREATALYGMLSGFAAPFMIMPTTFTAALALNVVPAVSELQARGDRAGVRARIALGVRLALLVTLPAAAGLAALATPIETVIFRAPAAGPLLFILSFGSVAIGLQQVTAAALQGLGRPTVPMLTLFFGAAVKFVLTYVLTGRPEVNVAGAAVATVAAFASAAALNALALARLGCGVSWWRAGAAPAVSAALMGLGVAAAFDAVDAALRRLAGDAAGGPLAIAVAVAAGVAIYGVLAARTGAVRPEDVQSLPRVGRTLVRLGRALRLWPRAAGA
ncbi:MAG: polysaccharide biosynthesis protein [Firmicutes bacterium]|nr:polysaccharide biosynthesis protein [Bacillota bacterium]